MARHNQGIFWKHTRDCRNIENEYREFMDNYFDGYGNLKDSLDFISSFAYSANALYLKSYEERRSLIEMQNNLKFENDNKRQKYIEFSENMLSIAKDVYNKYHEALEMYSHSGLSPAESTTVDKLEISGVSLV